MFSGTGEIPLTGKSIRRDTLYYACRHKVAAVPRVVPLANRPRDDDRARGSLNFATAPQMDGRTLLYGYARGLSCRGTSAPIHYMSPYSVHNTHTRSTKYTHARARARVQYNIIIHAVVRRRPIIINVGIILRDRLFPLAPRNDCRSLCRTRHFPPHLPVALCRISVPCACAFATTAADAAVVSDVVAAAVGAVAAAAAAAVG